MRSTQADVRDRMHNLVVIVLGIDPGLASTGYGVVEAQGAGVAALDSGVIMTRAEDVLERRLALLYNGLVKLIEEYGFDAVALETLYFGQNVRTAFAVGQARGVCMVAAGERNLPCASYTPQQVKSAVSGYGHASKDQVARMVQSILGMASMPISDHASDALAVAICHINTGPWASAIAAATAAALRSPSRDL